MNLAIDLPDDIAQVVRNLPDQRGFLLEAIQRELQRRKAQQASVPNGDAIARICERIAARNTMPSIPDPSAWQREIRKDRPLPGRDD
jgi:hypothetical protein